MKGEGDLEAFAARLLRDDAVAPRDEIWARIESALPVEGNRFVPLFLTKYFWLLAAFLVIGLWGWWQLQRNPMQPLTDKQYTQRSSQLGISERLERQGEAHESKTPAIKNPSTQSNNQLFSTENDAGAASANNKSKSEIQGFKKTDDAHGELLPAGKADASKAVIRKENATEDTTVYRENILAEAVGKGAQPSPASVEPFNGSRFLENPITDLSYLQPIAPSWPYYSATLKDTRSIPDFGPKPLSGWVVGAFADIRSTSLRINNGREGSAQLVDSLLGAEMASANAGVGITFGYHFTPKWRVTSGIGYATWCRTTKYPVRFTVADAFEGTVASSDQIIPLEQDVQSATGIQTISVNAPAQVLINNTQTIPQDASLSEQLAIEECYSLLQIPLFIEYRHSRGRIGFLPGAGLSYEHVLKRSTALVGASAYALEGSIVQADAARKNFLSLTASLHVEYSITEHLHLRAGGNYKSWITPVYESELIKTFPRLISIDAGIIYIFQRR